MRVEREAERRSSAALGFAIDQSIVAHLEDALLACLAGTYVWSASPLLRPGVDVSLTVVATMPCAANAIANFPARDVVSNSGDVTDDFVAGHD